MGRGLFRHAGLALLDTCHSCAQLCFCCLQHGRLSAALRYCLRRYYEGKEFEIKLTEKKPGQLSEALKTALGMTEDTPPPWLINMQRYALSRLFSAFFRFNMRLHLAFARTLLFPYASTYR